MGYLYKIVVAGSNPVAEREFSVAQSGRARTSIDNQISSRV